MVAQCHDSVIVAVAGGRTAIYGLHAEFVDRRLGEGHIINVRNGKPHAQLIAGQRRKIAEPKGMFDPGAGIGNGLHQRPGASAITRNFNRQEILDSILQPEKPAGVTDQRVGRGEQHLRRGQSVGPAIHIGRAHRRARHMHPGVEAVLLAARGKVMTRLHLLPIGT